MTKIFVRVDCTHLEDGAVVPISITWRDGRVWKITRVIHSCSSQDNEFEGIRYKVLIGSAEKYLYRTGSRWYVATG